jgi:D-amino peptidase
MSPHYFISVDMEGLCGVASLAQCYPKHPDSAAYQTAVVQMAREVNTVTRAILQASPEANIIVNDAHSTMTNLSLEHLDGRVHLLSGKPKKCAMMAGLKRGFEGVIFLGYHAKAGTAGGVLNHSFHFDIVDILINTVSYGEAGINTLYANIVCEVPIILAAGDAAFCEELSPLAPEAILVTSKTGLSTTAALSVPQETYLKTLHQSMIKAMALKAPSLISLGDPYEVNITFANTLACDVVALNPAFQRIDGRTIAIEAHDFETAYRHIQNAYTLLAYSDTLK